MIIEMAYVGTHRCDGCGKVDRCYAHIENSNGIDNFDDVATLPKGWRGRGKVQACSDACEARLQSGIEERAIATLERFFPGIKEKMQKDHPKA